MVLSKLEFKNRYLLAPQWQAFDAVAKEVNTLTVFQPTTNIAYCMEQAYCIIFAIRLNQHPHSRPHLLFIHLRYRYRLSLSGQNDYFAILRSLVLSSALFGCLRM